MKKYLFLAAALLIAASGLWAKTPIIGISGYTEDDVDDFLEVIE